MANDLKTLNIIGIMSGTSLDGLDLALCSFSRTKSNWNYNIQKAVTLPYPSDIRTSLDNAINLGASEICYLDHSYGKWIGNASNDFLKSNNLSADWISSHGHTVFHQPKKGFTLQIGNCHDIAAMTGLPVVGDFRSMDVALGGNGAPLVPAGDEYLFSKYDFCLNLGGFSNISYRSNSERIAFDICPVNMGLNYLAAKAGLDFDCGGKIGRKGTVISDIVERLNNLDYYHSNPPKSLGREWFIKNIEPILDSDLSLSDVARSFYEHISIQISNVLNSIPGKEVLVTGGGGRNTFLVELIKGKANCNIVIPDSELIDFKEALIFAFLGYLRINEIPNVFSSVTGSSSDHCSGIIIQAGLVKSL
jgi:anhydro-N-acetylmuramic acid kinase